MVKRSPLKRLHRCFRLLTCRDLRMRQWNLLAQFMFFISLSFLIFYIFFISYLLPFTLQIFADKNFHSINDEYVSLNKDRQLQMSINCAATLNFFMLNAGRTATKINNMVSEILNLKTYPIHPLNWQAAVPYTYSELMNSSISSNLKSISYTLGSRTTGKEKTDYTTMSTSTRNVAKKMHAFNPLWTNQRELYMGRYYNYQIYRIYILYDDNVTDPLVFTYPAFQVDSSSFSFNFASTLISTTSAFNYTYTDDIFEPGKKRIVIGEPIFNTQNKTIGIIALQFDADELIKEIIDSNLDDKDFFFEQLLVQDIKTSQNIYLKKSSTYSSETNITSYNSDYASYNETSVNEGSPDIKTLTYDDEDLYITRVFSPSNYSTTNINSFDFLIAISGKLSVDQTQLDKIRTQIVEEFKDFLLKTTFGSLGFILLVTAILFFFTWCFISRSINRLTEFVNKPYILQNQKLKNQDLKKMNEIEKLFYVFDKFYNEEKEKEENKKEQNKKVHMLPVETSLNLYYNQERSKRILEEIDSYIIKSISPSKNYDGHENLDLSDDQICSYPNFKDDINKATSKCYQSPSMTGRNDISEQNIMLQDEDLRQQDISLNFSDEVLQQHFNFKPRIGIDWIRN